MLFSRVVPIFVLNLSGCVLLTLITFSVPFLRPFYFLHSSVAGGIKYGIWGWCLDSDDSCSPKQFGYHKDPELIPILLKLHVLFPIAAGLALLSSVSLIPFLLLHYQWLYPSPQFSLFSFLTFLTSLAAFAISLSTWLIAQQRFRNEFFEASLGPLIWMALAATIVNLIVAVSAGCGMPACGRKAGRRSSHIMYSY